MNRPRISRWRSEAARERFVAMEDEIWAERWPEPPPAQDVDTYAGPTRVYRWPGAGEPIVFLHGMGGTGLMWSPYVERLAGRDLCAIDTIGDVGRSVQRIPIEDADGLARWLAESLTGAGIERAHLVGTSYGGFLALGLAVREPERVSSLTLIDSGGLAPFRLGRFMLWGLPNLVGSLAPGPVRRRLARRRPLLEDPRIMRMALHAQRNHPFRLPGPVVLTDAELRSVEADTVVIVAGRSAPFAPAVQAERARLIPDAEVDVLAGAGHEVSWTHVDHCVSRIARDRRPSGGGPHT
jgi:pimeloyl-ACP methyl ester carboxylesterase